MAVNDNQATLVPSEGCVPARAILEDRDCQVFRDARNRTLSRHLEGQVMQCARCKECFSPSQLVLNALEHRRDELIPDGSDSHVPLPLSPHRMDMAVMQHSRVSRGG